MSGLKYIWHFNVDENCVATYLGGQGDEGTPYAINCNITTGIQRKITAPERISFYPSPFMDQIKIQSTNKIKDAILRFKIHDFTSVEIMEGLVRAQTITDLGNLSPG